MKILITILLTIIAIPAIANESLSVTELCTNKSDVAASIMAYRQNGVDRASMLSVVAEDAPIEIRGRVLKFVLDAYNVPMYSTVEDKKTAIRDFKNKVMMECMQENSDGE